VYGLTVGNVGLERRPPPQVWFVVCVVYVLVVPWVGKFSRASAVVRNCSWGRVVKLRVRVIKLTAGVRVHVSMDGVMVKMVKGRDISVACTHVQGGRGLGSVKVCLAC